MNSDIFADPPRVVRVIPEESYEVRRAKWAFTKDNQRRLLHADIWRSCINCANFLHTKNKEMCMLNNQRPPAEIIVLGCECHNFDIPF